MWQVALTAAGQAPQVTARPVPCFQILRKAYVVISRRFANKFPCWSLQQKANRYGSKCCSIAMNICTTLKPKFRPSCKIAPFNCCAYDASKPTYPPASPASRTKTLKELSLEEVFKKRLTDVRFENCDLSNADFSGAVIHRAEFINCKLMGLNLNEASLNHLTINQCNCKFILMNYVKMKNIIISDCIFESSYIQESKLDKVEFKNCNFKQKPIIRNQFVWSRFKRF